MLLMLASILVGVALGLLRGGRLGNLADVRLAGAWLVVVAVAMRLVVAASELSAGTVATRVLLVGASAALLAFAWRNRRVIGMPLVLLGILLNAAVVTANGAMPVDPDAAARLGAVVEDRGTHRPLAEGDRLTPLADVIAVPALRAVVSAGDIVLAAGLAVLTAGLIAPQHAGARTAGHARTINDPPRADP